MSETTEQVKKRASLAAADVLNKHWFDESIGDIPLPVDATIIAEKLGAEVFLADLSKYDDLSGSIYVPPRGQGRAKIMVNKDHHLHRRRFTCAHEIGHLMDQRNESQDEFGFVDNRDTLASTGTDSREVFANQFAAALLMPSDEVEWLSAEHDLYALARRFRVSTEAMQHRLNSLRLQARS